MSRPGCSCPQRQSSLCSFSMAHSIKSGFPLESRTSRVGSRRTSAGTTSVLVTALVVFALVVGFSRFGNIRLGQQEEKAEFGIWSWFAMLFYASMGIGLVFWGVAEPLNYLAYPRPGVEAGSEASGEWAMTQTLFHWGVHAWGIYVVIGLAVAYSIHHRGRPLSIRYALEPLLGDRVKGWLGDLIDVVAIVATLFGVATSLGLGAMA